MDNNNNNDNNVMNNNNNVDVDALLRLLQELQLAAAERDREIAEREREIAEERDREITERDREIAEQRARREEVEREIAALDEELEELRRLREEDRQLREGTYFSTLTQVFGIVTVPVERDHFVALLRQECPLVHGHTTMDNKNDRYGRMVTAAINVDYVPANVPRTTLRTEDATAFWPTDIFGRKDTSAAHPTHLIPAAVERASMYDDVVMWTLALTRARLGTMIGHYPSMDEFWAVKQKAIHGARPAGGTNNIPHSGLKHSPLNKLCVRGQEAFDGQSPCLFIIPIMTLDEMRDWEGGAYQAIVLVEASPMHTLESVCLLIGMTQKGDLATDAEIELARVLLRGVLGGLAFSYTNRRRRHPDMGRMLNALPDHSLERGINALGGVSVPVMADNGHVRRVRKVPFGAPGGHPAPDPLLVAVKAAVSWSARHSQRLLAGEEFEDDIDSLSRQAEEEYVERLRQLSMPQTGEEIGLGQPEGYYSDVSMDSDCFNADDSHDGSPVPDVAVNSELREADCHGDNQPMERI